MPLAPFSRTEAQRACRLPRITQLTSGCTGLNPALHDSKSTLFPGDPLPLCHPPGQVDRLGEGPCLIFMGLGQHRARVRVHALAAMPTRKDARPGVSPRSLCAAPAATVLRAPCLARPWQSREASHCRPTHEPVAHHVLNQ